MAQISLRTRISKWQATRQPYSAQWFERSNITTLWISKYFMTWMKSTIGNVLVYLSSTTLFKLHFYSLVAFKSEYILFLLYFYFYQHWENNFGNLRISRPPKGLSRLKAYSVGQGYSYKKNCYVFRFETIWKQRNNESRPLRDFESEMWIKFIEFIN